MRGSRRSRRKMSRPTSDVAENAIRDELDQIEKDQEALKARKQALRAALGALRSTNGQPAKRVARRPRQTSAQTKEAVMEYLRKNRVRQSPADIVRGVDAPDSSIYKVLSELVDDGKVKVIGRTARGRPIVQYKETKVRPGEEVKT
jgi:response regulator of citrate/malate metabolism